MKNYSFHLAKCHLKFRNIGLTEFKIDFGVTDMSFRVRI